MDICIFCKAELRDHCDQSTCDWRRCRICQTTYWPARRRVLHHGELTPWPYSVNDDDQEAA